MDNDTLISLLNQAKNQFEYDRIIDKYVFKLNKYNGKKYKKKYGILSACTHAQILKKETSYSDFWQDFNQI